MCTVCFARMELFYLWKTRIWLLLWIKRQLLDLFHHSVHDLNNSNIIVFQAEEWVRVDVEKNTKLYGLISKEGGKGSEVVNYLLIENISHYLLVVWWKLMFTEETKTIHQGTSLYIYWIFIMTWMQYLNNFGAHGDLFANYEELLQKIIWWCSFINPQNCGAEGFSSFS